MTIYNLNEKLLTVRQIADYLNVSKRYVYQLIDKGVIKRVEKLPGVVRVHPEELAKLLPGVGNAIIHTKSTEHLQNNEPVLGPIEPS